MCELSGHQPARNLKAVNKEFQSTRVSEYTEALKGDSKWEESHEDSLNT